MVRINLRNLTSACLFSLLASAAAFAQVPTYPSGPIPVQPNFDWIGLSTTAIAGMGANSYYLLQVNSDPTFTATPAISITAPMIIASTSMPTTDGVYFSTYTLGAGTWYWRVAAVDGVTYVQSPWSAVSTFTFNSAPPVGTNYTLLTSTGGALGEAQWTNQLSGVRTLLSVTAALSGLAVSTSALPSGLGTIGLGTTSSGYSVMYTTTAAAAWTGWSESASPLPSGQTSASSLVTFKGLLYMITQTGNIYSSPDGVTWTDVYVGPGSPTGYRLWAFNGTLYAGIGPILYSSPDGVTWGLVLNTGDYTTYSMGYYNGNLYLGTYTSGYLFRSPTGATGTWIKTASLPTAGIDVLNIFNGQFYAAGDNVHIYLSTDSVNWNVTLNMYGQEYPFSMTPQNHEMYVNAGQIMGTANGTSWAIALNTPWNSNVSLTNANGNLYAGDTTLNNLYASADGSVWIHLAGGPGPGHATSFNGNLFAPVGSSLYKYTPIPASLTGTDGTTSAQTLEATGLSLASSTSAVTCGGGNGGIPCNATNQVIFTVSDMAGNSRFYGPYAVLVDTTPPVVSISPATPGVGTILVTASATDGMSGVAGFQFFASSASTGAQLIASPLVTSPAYTFSGLIENTPYNVYVVAYDYANNSSTSTTVSTTTLEAIDIRSIAPATAEQGSTIPALKMVFPPLSGNPTWNALTVNVIGSGFQGSAPLPPDSDFINAEIYSDALGTGVFNPAVDARVGVTGVVNGVAAFTALGQTLTGAATYFVVLQTTATAGVSDTVGAEIAAASDVAMSNGTLGDPFPISSSLTQLLDAPNNLYVSSAAAGTPAYVPQGTTNVPMIALPMYTANGTSALKSLVVHYTGVSESDLNSVTVYQDSNQDGVFDAGDAQVGTFGSFSVGFATVTFIDNPTSVSSITVVHGSTQTYFLVANVSAGATLGDAVAVQIDSASSLGVQGSSDSVVFSGYPFASIDVVIQSSNTLTVDSGSVMPPVFLQGRRYAVVQSTLTTNTGLAQVNQVTVSRLGAGADADLTAVEIWQQSSTQFGQPFTPSAPNTLLGSGTLSAGTATIAISTANIQAGTTTVMFIAYAVSPTAGPGDQLGAKLDAGAFQAVSPETLVTGNFPFQTSTATIQRVVSTMTILGADVSPGTLLQGTTNQAMLKVQVWAGPNPVSWSSFVLTRQGVGGSGDVTALQVFVSTDGNANYDSSDNPVTAKLSLTGAQTTTSFLSPQTITASTATYFIVVDVSPNASPGDTFGLAIASTTGFALGTPNTVSPLNLPIQSSTPTITAYPNIVSVATATLTPASGANPGASNVPLESMSLNTNMSSAQWLSAGIHLSGTGSFDADVQRLQLWYCSLNCSSFNPAYDTVVASTSYISASSSATLVFAPLPQGLNTAAQTYFLTVDLSSTSTPGDTIIAANTASDYVFDSPNTPATGSGFTSNALKIMPPAETMFVVAYESAPATAVEGTPNVVMQSLSLWMGGIFSGTVNSLQLSRSGAGSDSDVTQVQLALDSNGNGVYDPGVDVVLASGTFSGGTVSLDFASQTITASTQTWFVIYSFSPTANAGDAVGANIANSGAFGLAYPNTASAAFPLQSTNTKITPTEDAVYVSYSLSGTASSLKQGATAQLMMNLTLQTTANTVLTNSIVFVETGTATALDISALRVYQDVNGTGQIQANDPQIADVANPFAGGKSAAVSLNQPVGTAPTNLLVAVDIYNYAGNGDTFGLVLPSTTSVLVPAPNYVLAQSGTAFPLATNVLTISKLPDTLTIAPTSLLASAVVQGQAAQVFSFKAWASHEYVTINQIDIQQPGNLAPAGIDSVSIYADSNGDGILDTGDILVGSGTVNAVQVADIALSSAQTVTTSTQTYFVVYAIDPNATIGATVGADLSGSSSIILASPSDSVSSLGLPFATPTVPVLSSKTPIQPVVTLSSGAYSSSFDSIAFVWTSTVATGSLASAQYAIGTSPGATNTVPWTSMSPTPGQVTANGLFLANGGIYYVSVKATSSWGDVSPVGTSSGQLIDYTVPTAPQITSALVGPNSVDISWTPSTTGPSGLRGYLLEYQNALSPLWYDAANLVPLGTLDPTGVQLSSANLVGATIYSATGMSSGTLFFRVYGVSNAGLASPASNIVRVQYGALPTSTISNVSSYPNPFDSRSGVATITYTLNTPATANVRFYTVFGVEVRAMSVGGGVGTNTLTWDGSDDRGRKLAKGIYIMTISAAGETARWKIGVIH